MPEKSYLTPKPKPSSPPRPVKEGRKGPGAGFYEKVLDEAEKMDFDIAAGVDGIDDEIAVLRLKIKQILRDKPEDLELYLAAINLLARLVKTRYSMNKKQEKNLGEAIKNIIKEIGVPLGITLLNKKL